MKTSDIVDTLKAVAVFASVVIVCQAAERIVDRYCNASNSDRVLRIMLSGNADKEIE